MQTKLIKTEDYLLLVEDIHHPNLNVHNWYVCKDLSAIGKITNITMANYEGISTEGVGLSFLHHQANTVYKILAHLPLNNAPILEGVDLLPPFKKEVDVEKLACNIYNLSLDEYEYISEELSQNRSLIEEHYKDMGREEIAERYFDVISFIAGYNAAQAKQFSLEDMKKAIDLARLGVEQTILNRNTGKCFYNFSTQEIIQSLSTQQLPIDFIPRLYPKYTQYDGFEEDDEIPTMSLMTTTNSQGQKVVQGEYKFD